ncbi:unnamed protein product, partial [marine sediment metagenome]
MEKMILSGLKMILGGYKIGYFEMFYLEIPLLAGQ